MAYRIRHAAMEDLPAIEEIYSGARAFMAANGNPNQWGTTHPARERLLGDIQEKNLYVVEDAEKIRGVFALISGEDPTYRVIYQGMWHSDAPYAALHRVAGDGSGGIFQAAVSYAKTRRAYLRVDTHRNNLPMQRAIQRAGFSYCGIILTEDGSPRLAYDQ